MNDQHRRAASLRLLALGAVTIAAVTAVGTVDPEAVAVLTGCALLLAIGLAMAIPVPWGGMVPLGYAIAIPVAASDLTVGEQGTVAVMAIAIAIVDIAADRGAAAVVPLVARVAPSIGAAVGASVMVDGLAPAAGTIGRAVSAALALVVVDALIAGWLLLAPDRIEMKAAVPVYLAVVSAATLVAVTVDQVGVLMAGVPVLPLLLARFSFQRYATANATLEQTVLALGFVPELVGLASVGQSERVAHYADRMAESLGFDRRSRQRIVIASRLHRLGAVRFDGVDLRPLASLSDPATMASEGGRILRRSGFPEEITELVEQARGGSLDGPAPSLESTVIRVAVAFDAVVGDDPRRARLGVGRVSAWADDRDSRRAAASLRQLVTRGGSFVGDAVGAGQRFRDSTDDLDLDRLFAAGRGEAVRGPGRPS